MGKETTSKKARTVEELTKGFEELAKKKGVVKDNKAVFIKTLDKATRLKRSKDT